MIRICVRSALLVLAVLLAGAPAGSRADDPPPPLITAQWLQTHLNDQNVRVVEIGAGRARLSYIQFMAGHIPGAAYTDYRADDWRTRDRNGVIDQLPSLAALERLVGGLGISNDDHVILAAIGDDNYSVGAAARIYWTFKVIGHEKISILDGGMTAYEALEGALTETGRANPEAASYTGHLNSDILIDRDAVRAALGGNGILVDYRSPGEYQGRHKILGTTKGGTIPGAVNIHEKGLLRGGGRFRPQSELRAIYHDAGAYFDGLHIAFCTTGHRAALGWFVASELLGNKSARLYDGSMVDWVSDRSAPLAQPEPE